MYNMSTKYNAVCLNHLRADRRVCGFIVIHYMLTTGDLVLKAKRKVSAKSCWTEQRNYLHFQRPIHAHS